MAAERGKDDDAFRNNTLKVNSDVESLPFLLTSAHFFFHLYTYTYVSTRVSRKVCIARNIMFAYITFWGNIFRENMASSRRQSTYYSVNSASLDRRRQRRWKQRRVLNMDKSLVAPKRVVCEFVWIIKSYTICQPNDFAR